MNVHVPIDDGWGVLSRLRGGKFVDVEGLSMASVPYSTSIVCDNMKLRRIGRERERGEEGIC